MTDTSPTASGSPSPRRGRVFRAAAPRQQQPQPVLDEELTAPAGYGSSAAPPSGHARAATPVGAPAPYTGTKGDVHAEVLVLGAGPGGYTAAFRAADLGRNVVMVDSRGPLGGVCLNVGCIPSKALLHAAKVIAETKEMTHAGLAFPAPTIDLDALRGWKDSVVTRLTGGLTGLAKQRKVQTLVGTGTFTGDHMLSVAAPDGTTTTCRSTRRSSPPAPNRSPCRSSRTTTPGSSTPPAPWTSSTSPNACWCSAAGSSAWRWPCVYSELGTKI